MHTTLSLCGWHTLYTMYARFVFQCAINIGTRNGKVDLLVTTYGSFADAGDGELPTLRVAVALVHLKQIAGKQTSLIATCSSTNLHLHILRILRILRNQGYLDFLLEFGLKFLVGSQFLTGHLLHLGIGLIGQDILRLLDAIQTGDVTLAGIHDVAQILVFFRQFHKTVLIGNHIGVGNQG